MMNGRRRKSMGRQKIEIKRIESEEARQVCFSKRRAGLFKKANELSVLCGAEVAVVVFSPAGRPFSYGHPSVEDIIDRFTSDDDQSQQQQPGRHAAAASAAAVHDFDGETARLRELLQAEKERKEKLEEAIGEVVGEGIRLRGEAALEGVGPWELEKLHAELKRVQDDAAKTLNQLVSEEKARNSSMAENAAASDDGPFRRAMENAAASDDCPFRRAMENATPPAPPAYYELEKSQGFGEDFF